MSPMSPVVEKVFNAVERFEQTFGLRLDQAIVDFSSYPGKMPGLLAELLNKVADEDNPITEEDVVFYLLYDAEEGALAYLLPAAHSLPEGYRLEDDDNWEPH